VKEDVIKTKNKRSKEVEKVNCMRWAEDMHCQPSSTCC